MESRIDFLSVREGYEGFQNTHRQYTLEFRAYDYMGVTLNIAIIGAEGEVKSGINSWFGNQVGYLNLRSLLEKAINNDSVEAILLVIDSPGGTVEGLMETARAIRKASEIKPVYAFAEGLCCSAAYLLAAAASKVYASAQTEVGSCGVICQVYDDEKYLEKNGFLRMIFRSKNAPKKCLDPTTEEGKKAIQSRIDEFEDDYIAAVAEFRGLSKENVISNFGKGATFLAPEAKKRGMIDEIIDYDDVFNLIKNELCLQSTNNLPGGNMDLTALSKEEKNSALSALLADPDLAAVATEIAAKERSRIEALNKLSISGVTDSIVTAAISEGKSAEEIALKCFDALKAENQSLSEKLAKLKPIESIADNKQNVTPPAETGAPQEKSIEDAANENLKILGLEKGGF